MGKDLHAETAADMAGGDPQFRRIDPEDRPGKDIADQARSLGRGGESRAAGLRIVHGKRAARLHRIGDHPVVDQPEFADMVGPRQRRLDPGLVALVPVVDQIVRDVIVEQRRAVRRRMLGVDGSGQFLIVHGDPLDRVARLGRRFGNDHCHRMAGIAGTVFRQNAVGAVRALRPVPVLDRDHAGQVAQAVGSLVRPGEDADHARRRGGLRGVDAEDAGVGVGRTQDEGPGLAVD